MSLEAPRCTTWPCASCPGGTICRAAGLPSSMATELRWWLYRGAVTPPCYPGRAGAAPRAAVVVLDTGHKGSCSVEQQAGGPAGWCQPFWEKLLALRKGPGSPFPWEQQALTHSLCTANTFTTLELPECLMRSLTASSSPLKSLLHLYAKITNTSSVMAIFTHILYFTAVQKKCAI